MYSRDVWYVCVSFPLSVFLFFLLVGMHHAIRVVGPSGMLWSARADEYREG